MKKAKKTSVDDLRSEYKRSDFGTMARGKFAGKLRKKSNIAVIDPELAKLFPNSESVNAALKSLAEVAKRSARSPRSRARKSA